MFKPFLMKKLIYILSLLFLFACDRNDTTSSQDDLLNDFNYADSVNSQVVVSEDIINEIIHSIPSPIEMTSLIQSTGASFNQSLLNNPDHIDKYISTHQKAINLGIYGAELGYLNIYGKTMISIDYFSAVRSLAKDLKVDQFFDFKTLKRLAESSKNIDSLINITTQSYSKMDSYLRKQNRTKTSVLIVTGTFIEGLYIATQIAEKNPNPELIERIGEQKMSINNLHLMLDVYKSDNEISALGTKIDELKKLFDEVEIITTYGEPTSKEVDGVLVIEDNSTSKVIIREELVIRIKEKIKEIRSKII